MPGFLPRPFPGNTARESGAENLCCCSLQLHLDSVQLRAHPHHSFEAEGDLIRILAKGGRVKYCSDPMIPANKLETCGWVEADLNVS